MCRALCATLLFCACVFPSGARSQERPSVPQVTLAEVGGKAVTAQDLIERIELMPWMEKDRPGSYDSAKVKALQSLVAEQILGMEALARGIGADSAGRTAVRNMEKLMVRDELYKRQVSPNVKVSDQDVAEGLKRFAWQVRVLMIVAGSKADAQSVAAALRARGNPDSVLAHPPGGGSRLSADTVTVTYGLLERKQEDAVYALTQARPVSNPLELQRAGWAVLVLLDRRTNPEYAKLSLPERGDAVRKRARQRRELEVASRYYGSVLSPRRAEAKPEVFDLVARVLRDLFVADPGTYRNASGYRLDMAVDAAEAQLQPRLGEILVDIDGGGMTVGEVLDGFKYFNFLFPRLNQQEFHQRLNVYVQEVVARELMAREAYRQRLDQSEAVQHDVGTWATYWRATAMERTIGRDVSVSDEEVINYLVERAGAVPGDPPGRDYEVNVREILTDSLRGALDLMERVIAGGNMRELARSFSKRTAWAVRGGESGFFPVRDHPGIGFRAMAADTGTLLGPVLVPEGYSLFTVLGKRQRGGDSVMTFDSLRTIVRSELLGRKARARVNAHVASAAANYHVKLYYDRLRSVKIMPANMVTRRMIGFGGSILAAPTLVPLWEWVRMTRDVQEVFP